MLCQFSVKNYKSIRDEVTFDMQAAAISEHQDHLIIGQDGERYLPISVLYGPNGGGKTNVLDAMHCLWAKVVRPLYISDGNDSTKDLSSKVSAPPFAFSETCRENPTEFELFFCTSKAEYRYNLEVKKEHVFYERLDMLKFDTGRKSTLLERAEGKTTLRGPLYRLKVSEDLSDTLPVLTYLGLTYRKNDIIEDIFDWFENGICFINYGIPFAEYNLANSYSDELKEFVLDMLQEMDLDIVDFRIEKKEKDRIVFYTKHKVDDEETELRLGEESSGTIKVFSVIPAIAESLSMGSTLIIDELDAKLHPLILRYIITLYTDLSKNKHGAQLIFTSHDLSTMNSEIFRRDEIWFVAKGNQENSQLYSLVEFKDKDGKTVRKDARYDKQYLEGKYGADPYLKKIIDWEQFNG